MNLRHVLQLECILSLLKFVPRKLYECEGNLFLVFILYVACCSFPLLIKT